MKRKKDSERFLLALSVDLVGEHPEHEIHPSPCYSPTDGIEGLLHLASRARRTIIAGSSH